jgi:hypothetical protein
MLQFIALAAELHTLRPGGSKGGVMKAGGQKVIPETQNLDVLAAKFFKAATQVIKGVKPAIVPTVSNPPVGYTHADNGFHRFTASAGVNAARFANKAASAVQDRAAYLADSITGMPIGLGCRILALLIQNRKHA